MINGLVAITEFNLYTVILLLAGFVIVVLGLTFVLDARTDLKAKQKMMASLDIILGAGLNIIGACVMLYVWTIL